MAKSRIEVDGLAVTFTSSKSLSSLKNVSDISRFYCLTVGSDVFANDSISILVLYSDQVWLVPDDISGGYQFRKLLLTDDLAGKGKVAQLDNLPANWRKRVFFIPGVDADAKILGLSEFKKIEESLSILDNHELGDYI